MTKGNGRPGPKSDVKIKTKEKEWKREGKQR
jgi:hypothetical protein